MFVEHAAKPAWMFVLFSSFLRMYAYLEEGECDVTAASHVLAMSHVAEVSHTIVIAIARAIAKAIVKAIEIMGSIRLFISEESKLVFNI